MKDRKYETKQEREVQKEGKESGGRERWQGENANTIVKGIVKNEEGSEHVINA